MNDSTSTRVIRIDRRSPVADLLNGSIKDGMPVPIFERLAAKFPGYLKNENALELKRPIGHPDLDELLSLVVEYGAAVQVDRNDFPCQVEVRDYVVYSESELSSSPLVECEVHKPNFSDLVLLTEGDGPAVVCRFSNHAAKREFGGMANLWHILAVRGKARESLEKAGLKHLQLVPVVSQKPDGRWPSGVDPLYIVWSDYELPPVDMPVFDNDHKIYPPEGRPKIIKRGCYLLDGYEILPRLKYKDVDPGAFDVARSYERFGGEEPCYHKLVYSQRARSVLEDIGMKLELRPVRITASAL
jgi:hypothetical protein